MMTPLTLTERIEAIAHLGTILGEMLESDAPLIADARNLNGWFTEPMVRKAFGHWKSLLTAQNVEAWAKGYSLEESGKHSVRVGLVMAGNVPLVGLHDMLALLLVGVNSKIKLSSTDGGLTEGLLNTWIAERPALTNYFEVIERLKDYDAVIATGSNNSSRYFEHYFSHVPHVIRKNRTGVAILTGIEPLEELRALGEDIFTYYGLGCRNVTRILVPEGYNPIGLFEALESEPSFKWVADNHKYFHNYEYQLALALLNQEDIWRNDFLILRKLDRFGVAIGTIHRTEYANSEALGAFLSEHSEEIQVIASAQGWYQNSIPFGLAQMPSLTDYADGVDIVQFALGLGQ
jgi:hypothetical protein